MENIMEHEGIIVRIYKDKIDVKIIQETACSGCHVRSACSISDQAEKIIEIPFIDNELKIGERVMIVGTDKMGIQVVLLAFVYPFLLLFGVLLISYQISEDDLLSGVLSLLVLIPYYLSFYLFRDMLKKKFVFTLKR